MVLGALGKQLLGSWGACHRYQSGVRLGDPGDPSLSRGRAVGHSNEGSLPGGGLQVIGL